MMTVFEKAGRYPDIIDLSIGDPDLKTPQKIIDLAFADAGAGHTKYTDRGTRSFGRRLPGFTPKNTAWRWVNGKFLSPRPGALPCTLLWRPSWTPATRCSFLTRTFSLCHTQVRLGGGVPVFVPCRERTAGSRIWSALRSIDAAHQGAGHQYTQQSHGCVLPRPTLEAVARFARKNDLLVVADDIYTSFCYSEPFLPV